MLGLGETLDEVASVMRDLRAASVDILTLGQYLRPSAKHLPIIRYVPVEEFAELKRLGYEDGLPARGKRSAGPQLLPRGGRRPVAGTFSAGSIAYSSSRMFTFLLWCILFVLCWPLALAALVLYPIVWLILLPFRIVGIAVGGVLHLVWAIVTLPFTIIRRIAWLTGTAAARSPPDSRASSTTRARLPFR